MERTGAQLLIDSLQDVGIEILFGIPGGVVIPIFDVLYDSELRAVLMRHEQAAAHAADGYARASGKLGCCLATSGPGATNLVTGIATANFDSVPILAITGQVRRDLIGNDAFQEADIVGITRGITKHNYLVRDARDIPRIVREAAHIATTGRCGPVLIDVPVDVSTSKVEGELSHDFDIPGYRPSVEGNARQIERAAELINQSERPVLYVGGGVIASGAHEELLRIAEAGNIPVTTTLMGLGAFPETHRLALRMLGMHGTPTANYAVMSSDLLIGIGVRFDDRITGKISEFAEHAEIVHIDVDPSSIGKNVRVKLPVVGDAHRILVELVPLIKRADRAAWVEQIESWRMKHKLTYRDNGKLKPQYVVQQIREVTGGDAVICTEVGQNQMWAAQWFTFDRPRQFITSGGLGTMGYGFPAAIGAQFARPGTPVFDIAGDGSIQMNIQELATVAHNNVPVKIALLNNGYLGMVRQWQELFFNRRYSHTKLNGNPDFVKLAEAYGVAGMAVEKTEEVRPALEKALSIDGPVLLDFRIDPEENVFPIVPAGERIDKMIDLA
ncbi:MAG: biosynthetic-type acetolactate synthase large subunit [Planctomycetota bacterium]